MPEINVEVIAVGAGVLASAVLFYVRIWAMILKPAMEAQKVAAAQMAEVLTNLKSLNAEVGKLRDQQGKICDRLGRVEVHEERTRDHLRKLNGISK